MNDPTLERIWKVRREIYAKCESNPQKLVAYYIQRQNQHPQRFLSSEEELTGIKKVEKEPA